MDDLTWAEQGITPVITMLGFPHFFSMIKYMNGLKELELALK